MSIAAQPIGEPPISAQSAVSSTSGKPPRRRQAVARPDAGVQPEAR